MAARTVDLEIPTTSDDRLTLLDLAAAVQDAAESEAEANATLRHMVESGRVGFDSVDFDDLPFAA